MTDTARHPCFSPGAHAQYARVHLPVAPRCNVRCGFCDRQFSCVNESRPGITAEVLSPDAALERLQAVARRLPHLAVAGIAGPGDPLANPHETLKTLELVRSGYPALMTCVSTNGLALPEYAADLASLGVSHVTVTVNAADAVTARRVYAHIGTDGGDGFQSAETKRPAASNREADAERLLAAQEIGVRALTRLGVVVKINTVIIPGINDGQTAIIAERAASWGAQLMNCIAMLPVAGTPLGACQAPSLQLMERLRSEASAYLPQMKHCARCRADAAGLIGKKTTLGNFAPCRASAPSPFRISVPN